MQTRIVEERTTEEYVSIVAVRGRGLFQSKELRDAVSIKLSANGYVPTRGVVVGQNLHPEYVTDYVGTLETGFGNTQYQTYWSKLYEVRVLR